MTEITVFEQAVHTRQVALSVIDGLARALRTTGEFPPPLGEIECHILRQTVPVARTFDPPLILWTRRNASGFLILDGTYAREGARAPRLPLGAGTYRIRVRGPYYQDTQFTLVWPPPADDARVPRTQPNKLDNIELLPGGAYPLPDVTTGRFQLGVTILRGSLFTSSGDPIPDVLVEVINLPPFLQPPELPPLAVWPFLQARSSAAGDWTIVLPGRRYVDNAPEIPAVLNPPPPPIKKQITVRVHGPNGAVDVQPDVELGTEHSIKNTALRGQVVGPGGRPIGGAHIATSVGPETSVSQDNGLWFLYFDLNQISVNNVTVTVTTPNGATASDSSASVKHDGTVVVPTFHFS